MSKARKSKLDAFTARLDDWFGVEHLGLAAVQKLLAEKQCVVSIGRLSEWWQARQGQLATARMLSDIRTGAEQCRALEKEFGEHPAPELEFIIKLNRVLIMQLTTQGQANPELLETSDRMTRTVLEFAKLGEKAKVRELAREQFEFDAARAALAQAEFLIDVRKNKALTELQQIELVRERLWGIPPA